MAVGAKIANDKKFGGRRAAGQVHSRNNHKAFTLQPRTSTKLSRIDREAIARQPQLKHKALKTQSQRSPQRIRITLAHIITQFAMN